jgi:hypothetical protein
MIFHIRNYDSKLGVGLGAFGPDVISNVMPIFPSISFACS